MALKIYSKRGVPNYKEKRMIKKLEEVLSKKAEKDSTFEANFRSATNSEELQDLYNKYCVDEVEFEEVFEKEDEHKNFRDGIKDNVEPKEDVKEVDYNSNVNDFDDDKNIFVDPLNREEPIVRDYVMTDEFKDESKEEDKGPTKTEFEEPQSFNESFEMPGSDIGTQKTDNQKKKDKKPEAPFNPSYDDMSSGRKKRSTKKFAKYIVEGVCMLAEKGFVWWTTKNISEEKLAEYELSGEYDFNVLLTLETGQDVYVKQWFKQQRITAEQLSKFEQDEKDDLAEVLAEVLNEKGFAPTATQECLIIMAKVFGGKVILAAQMSAGINNVLAQLKTPERQEQRVPQNEPPQVQNAEIKSEINTPIVEWNEDLMDETADAVGNPAVDNQLTIIE